MVCIADITGRGLVLRSLRTLLTRTKTDTGKSQRGIGEYLRLFFVCIMITPILICGCSYIDEGLRARLLYQEANDFFNQGKYEASLSKYEQIIEKPPAVADRVLFEMGIIYA
ncbi:MAG: hypothetical protein P8Z31_11325, partial [Gammaproteobacteria bacterium]